jgi:hypothetical protein
VNAAALLAPATRRVEGQAIKKQENERWHGLGESGSAAPRAAMRDSPSDRGLRQDVGDAAFDDKLCVTFTRYQWAYLFGAVCPARAVGAGRVMPYANTDAMNEHLEEIRKASRPAPMRSLFATGQVGTTALVWPCRTTSPR